MGNLPKKRRTIAKIANRLSDFSIANSQSGLIAWGVPKNRGKVIYNGFDPVRLSFCKGISKSRENNTSVIMAARMDCYKDHQTYFSALRVLGKETGWHFIAIGSGPKKEEYINTTNDLIDKGVLTFPDPSLEVLSWVSRADIGVLLSNPEVHAEGCSNAIMEYMACGLPVICSDGGGNRELVIDEVTGFVIPPNDKGALVEKLRFLKKYPEVALRMGENGRKRIFQEFSLEKMIRETVYIYEMLLEK